METYLHWLGQNITESLNFKNTPHISPYRASYGVHLCKEFWENWSRYNDNAL